MGNVISKIVREKPWNMCKNVQPEKCQGNSSMKRGKATRIKLSSQSGISFPLFLLSFLYSESRLFGLSGCNFFSFRSCFHLIAFLRFCPVYLQVFFQFEFNFHIQEKLQDFNWYLQLPYFADVLTISIGLKQVQGFPLKVSSIRIYF